MEFQKNGAALIQKMIDEAEGFLTVKGCYEIEDTILLPSHFHLVLEDCHLRMADGTACNMFRNQNAQNATAPFDEDITVEGRGRVILDGGVYNGLSEKNSLKDGNPHISVNNTLLFVGVKGFRVTGLHIRNQRWWAMNFIGCENGYIAHIDFLADCTRIGEDGREVRGLLRRAYAAIKVKNADGIDIRMGCRNILIEHITGFTEDDTVAVTALYGELEKMYCPSDTPHEISGILIRNVISSAYCAIVRLLCQGDMSLKNILVDGIVDTSKTCDCLDRGLYGVRVGDTHEYESPQPTLDRMHSIVVKNVFAQNLPAALHIVAPEGSVSYADVFGAVDETKF